MSLVIVKRPPKVSLVNNDIVYKLKSNLDYSQLQFYTVYCDLFVDNKKIITLTATPDNDSNTRFNVAPFLRNYVNVRFQYPAVKVVTQLYLSIIHFKVEFSHGHFLLSKIERPSVSFDSAMPGALSVQALARLNTTGNNPYSFLKNNKQFLTWQPYYRAVTKDELIKLYFVTLSPRINLQEYGFDLMTIKLIIKIHYNDTTIIIEKYSANYTSKEYLFEINSTFSSLDVEKINPTLTIKALEMWVSDGEIDITEHRIFLIDYKKYQFERQFIFRNSFDVFDTFKTIGKLQETNKFKRNDYVNILPDNYTVTNREIQQERAVLTQKYKVNSGWITEQKLNFLTDALISDEVFLIEDSNVIAINITTKKIKKHNDDEHLHEVTFEYEIAYEESRYTNLDNTPYSLPTNNIGKGIGSMIINTDFIPSQNM